MNYRPFVLLLFLIAGATYADSPAIPFPYIKAAEYSSYYFKMIPEDQSQNNTPEIDPPYGVAYRLLENGRSIELWGVEGWYAFEVYLSANGEYLVRMGPWAEGKKPSKNHLAVAFYRNGNLLKKYSTSNLIRKSSSVDRTVSHYFWLKRDEGYPGLSHSNEFVLKTIENRVYRFDLTTGDVIEGKIF